MNKPKVIVTRTQFENEMDRLREVSDLVVIDSPNPPTSDELKENFPYKVIHLEGCEADDVIGTLVERTQEFGNYEPVMIVSADKDFIQLHKYDNVDQYSYVTRKEVSDPNPRLYLQTQISLNLYLRNLMTYGHKTLKCN